MDTQPTAAQIEVWESFKLVAQRHQIETNIASKLAENAALAVGFAQSKGKAQNVSIAPIVAEVRRLERNAQNLTKIVMDVDLGKLGLRFRGRDFDVMSPSGTPADQLTQYQLSGWPIIVVGIVVAAGIITWLAAERQRGDECCGKLSALTDEMDAMLCSDPNSSDCREWTAAKEREGFNERKNLIDTWRQMAAGLPEVVKTLGGGLHLALTVALIGAVVVFAWQGKKS